MGIFSKNQYLEFPISIYHPATFEPPLDLDMSLQFAINSTRKIKNKSFPLKNSLSNSNGFHLPTTISKRKGNQYTEYQKRHTIPQIVNESRILPWNDVTEQSHQFTSYSHQQPKNPPLIYKIENDKTLNFTSHDTLDVIEPLNPEKTIVESVCDSILQSNVVNSNENFNHEKSIENHNATCIPFEIQPISPSRYIKHNSDSLHEISQLILHEHSIKYNYSEHDENDQGKDMDGLDGLWDSSVFLLYGTFANTIEHDNANTLPEISQIKAPSNNILIEDIKESIVNERITENENVTKNALRNFKNPLKHQKKVSKDSLRVSVNDGGLESICEAVEEPSNFDPVFQKRFSYDYASSIKESKLSGYKAQSDYLKVYGTHDTFLSKDSNQDSLHLMSNDKRASLPNPDKLADKRRGSNTSDIPSRVYTVNSFATDKSYSEDYKKRASESGLLQRPIRPPCNFYFWGFFMNSAYTYSI